jgi:hypothetical protein
MRLRPKYVLAETPYLFADNFFNVPDPIPVAGSSVRMRVLELPWLA